MINEDVQYKPWGDLTTKKCSHVALLRAGWKEEEWAREGLLNDCHRNGVMNVRVSSTNYPDWNGKMVLICEKHWRFWEPRDRHPCMAYREITI